MVHFFLEMTYLVEEMFTVKLTLLYTVVCVVYRFGTQYENGEVTTFHSHDVSLLKKLMNTHIEAIEVHIKHQSGSFWSFCRKVFFNKNKLLV